MIRKNFTLLGNLVVFALLSLAGVASAQTFNGSNLNQNGNTTIPDACSGIANYNCNVTGTVTTLQKVTINITHTWDSDLDIYLQSPSGQRIALSTGNGGSVTTSPTRFSRMALRPLLAVQPHSRVLLHQKVL